MCFFAIRTLSRFCFYRDPGLFSSSIWLECNATVRDHRWPIVRRLLDSASVVLRRSVYIVCFLRFFSTYFGMFRDSSFWLVPTATIKCRIGVIGDSVRSVLGLTLVWSPTKLNYAPRSGVKKAKHPASVGPFCNFLIISKAPSDCAAIGEGARARTPSARALLVALVTERYKFECIALFGADCDCASCVCVCVGVFLFQIPFVFC